MRPIVYRMALQRAERAADDLISGYGAHARTMLANIELMAELLNIEVHYGGITSASARLVQSPNGNVLRVRTEDRNTQRGRFSIGHEIGHYKLHRPSNKAWCTANDMRPWQSSKLLEAEANAFAAALLLPKKLVLSQCTRSPPSLEIPKDLSKEFDVSLTASAIRFVRLCPEPCAIVQATKGRIDFAIKNDEFWPWIPIKEPLHRETLAYDSHRDRQQRYEDPEPVRAAAWTSDRRLDKKDIEIIEHTLYKKNFQQTLTLLWAKDLPYEDEIDEID